jgi:hypothetical protein
MIYFLLLLKVENILYMGDILPPEQAVPPAKFNKETEELKHKKKPWSFW